MFFDIYILRGFRIIDNVAVYFMPPPLGSRFGNYKVFTGLPAGRQVVTSMPGTALPTAGRYVQILLFYILVKPVYQQVIPGLQGNRLSCSLCR